MNDRSACGGGCGCGNAAGCGCCDGVEAKTPRAIVNRPGLSALSYRIGSHATFLESMKAGLTTHTLTDADGRSTKPLAGLRTRDSGDPAVAMLDAWATVADVLTFYQERIANEAFLRTATERRSVHELARLVGYTPRPGVAASTYLAYTIDDNTREDVVITQGSRVQSVPGPGELPQYFETSEDLLARAAWNQLRVRTTQPQTPETVINSNRVYLKGSLHALKKGAPLLIKVNNTPDVQDLFRIVDVVIDAAKNRTQVNIEPWISSAADESGGSSKLPSVSELLKQRTAKLTIPPSQPKSNSLLLKRSLDENSNKMGDIGLQLTGAVAPSMRQEIGAVLGGTVQTQKSELEVYAFNVRSGIFGNKARKRQELIQSVEDANNKVTRELTTKTRAIGEWPIIELDISAISTSPPELKMTMQARNRSVSQIKSIHENKYTIHLDSTYESIMPGSWIVIDASAVQPYSAELAAVHPVGNTPGSHILITKADVVAIKTGRHEYDVGGEVTRLKMSDPWLRFDWVEEEKNEIGFVDVFVGKQDQSMIDHDFEVIRSTVVYAQSERLDLAEEPIEQEICGVADEPIELDDIYRDLQPGRFVIFSGQRADLGKETSVIATEPLMITQVVHDLRQANSFLPIDHAKEGQKALAGDRVHTFVYFDKPLIYCYRRDSVRIIGNVVKATHGEIRLESLGNGDGAKALQTFALKQPPLTYLAAPTAVGAQSTLQVFVNDVRWHEYPSFVDQERTAPIYVTRSDDDGKTAVIFGNGLEGARLPTGIENVKAMYRSGIGRVGNVRAGQLTTLSTRPLGVKEVVNPLRASGGADRESRDQVRRNAPNGVMALDRLVSIRDYADFARSFAGIAKAHAVELGAAQRSVVHVTIAGADDIPIDPGSDLFVNLERALHDLGDPILDVELAVRELYVIVLEASIQILADYRWEKVVTDVRRQLLEVFGFERRELGQALLPSEVIATMQNVRGVAWVDLDVLGVIPAMVEDVDAQDGRRPILPDEFSMQIAALPKASDAAPISLSTAIGVPQARLNDAGNKFLPAGLAVFIADVPGTLVLNQNSIDSTVRRP